MKRRIWIPVIAALLVITSGKISKAQEKDYGTWLTVSVSKDLTKRLELEIEEEGTKLRVLKSKPAETQAPQYVTYAPHPQQYQQPVNTGAVQPI